MDRSLPLAHIPDACISGPSTITLPQAVALCTVSPRPLSREARFCGRKKMHSAARQESIPGCNIARSGDWKNAYIRFRHHQWCYVQNEYVR